MAQQTINVGTAPNDGTGTPLRTAFQYTNSNFSELYTALGGGSGLPGAANQIIFNNGSSLAGNANLTFNTALNKLVANNIETAANLLVGTSATITGDLTVDTSTLKVNSATDRVGIGTVSPAKRCEINQSANAFTTIGEGEILRLIGDDGNTVGRITEIGFGTGPTGAVYAPVTLGAINTSIAGYNHKAFYIATRTGTSDIAPVERYRIASDGVATWSNVGGVAGTAMTLNSTGLGIGTTVLGGNKLAIGSTSDTSATTNGINIVTNRATITTTCNGAVDAAGTTINYSWANGGQGPLIFRNAAVSNVMTLDSSGNVGIGVTPAGTGGCLQLKSGITFPATQVASSDANTLDDYEEGTWTPTITAGAGTPTTTTVNTAKYTKIGRLVTVEVDFSIVAIGTASGALNFTVPTGFNQSTDGNVGALREVGATASMGQIFYTAPTTVGMALYNNATVWVNGYRIRGTYTYTV